MKTRKITLTIFVLVNSLTIFAQLNPIKDLSFQLVSYEFGNPNCPQFNCYNLTWSKPDITYTDTLKGYNIYKNAVFYKYTTQTNASCAGIYPCAYLDLYDNLPFWLTVKAVYGNSSLESVADDSVYINTFAVNIQEIRTNELFCIKNPVKLGENISFIIPFNESENSIIEVISRSGQKIKEYRIGKSANSIFTISTNQLSCGLYFIKVKTAKSTLTTKLIIE